MQRGTVVNFDEVESMRSVEEAELERAYLASDGLALAPDIFEFLAAEPRVAFVAKMLPQGKPAFCP